MVEHYKNTDTCALYLPQFPRGIHKPLALTLQFCLQNHSGNLKMLSGAQGQFWQECGCSRSPAARSSELLREMRGTSCSGNAFKNLGSSYAQELNALRRQCDVPDITNWDWDDFQMSCIIETKKKNAIVIRDQTSKKVNALFLKTHIIRSNDVFGNLNF